MSAYLLVFLIGVTGIAGFIWAICKPERKTKEPHPGMPCDSSCDDYGGHNWKGDKTDTVAFLLYGQPRHGRTLPFGEPTPEDWGSGGSDGRRP